MAPVLGDVPPPRLYPAKIASLTRAAAAAAPPRASGPLHAVQLLAVREASLLSGKRSPGEKLSLREAAVAEAEDATHSPLSEAEAARVGAAALRNECEDLLLHTCGAQFETHRLSAIRRNSRGSARRTCATDCAPC